MAPKPLHTAFLKLQKCGLTKHKVSTTVSLIFSLNTDIPRYVLESIVWCNISLLPRVFDLFPKRRSELKNEAIAEFVNHLQCVWKSNQTRLSSEWYVISK